MERRDLRKGLLEAEEIYRRQAPSAAAEFRLRKRLFGPRRTTPRPWVAACGAAAAVALALLGIWRARAPSHLGEYEVANRSADFSARIESERTVHVMEGHCDLIDGPNGERIAVDAPIKLRKEHQGVRLLSGTATFLVSKRPVGAHPAQVLVSHGVIEVLGTRFRVRQRPDGGSVELFAGSIRFRAVDGRERTLVGSGELFWPLPPDASQPTTPAPKPPPAESHEISSARPPFTYADAEEVLQRVDELRSRGQYEDAVQFLKIRLKSNLHRETRERFSYELGSILTHQLSDSVRACEHWRHHLGHFRDGRYGPEVRKAMRYLRCGDSP